MRRAADFGCENVEHDLDNNDEQNIEETLLRLPNVVMAKKKSGPPANDSHDATGRTDQFGGPVRLPADQVGAGKPDEVEDTVAEPTGMRSGPLES